MPDADLIRKTTLRIIRTERPFHGCFVRNTFDLIEVIEPQLSEPLTEAERSDLARFAVDLMTRLKADDGGFRLWPAQKHATTDGVSQAYKARAQIRRHAGLDPAPIPGGEAVLAFLREAGE
jgi:hypothetical protein